MRPRGLGLAALLLLSSGLATLGAACFSPMQPACAFSCADDGLCPTSYKCGTDGLCHRDDGKGVCLLDAADAGADGASQ
jgi:hypothetical protein